MPVLSESEREFVAHCVKAQRVDRLGHFVQPTIEGRVYNWTLTDCACPKSVFYSRPNGDRLGRLYAVCEQHGFQQLGRAFRCVPQCDDGERNQRRRRSGASTERWYRRRGL